MYMTKEIIPLCLALITVGVGEAHADSDGYYCTGPGYVAYELRGWNWYTMGQHIVRVVKFANGKVAWAGDVAVKDFQPHLMKCDTSRVTIGGYDRGWLEYEIDVKAQPSITAERAAPDRQFKPGEHAPLPNLGNWSRSSTVPLVGDPTDQAVYQLDILVTQDQANPRCRDRVSRLVLKRNAGQRVAQQFVLYEGRSCETVD